MKDLRHLLLYTALTNSIRVAVFKLPDREGKCMSYPCFESDLPSSICFN